MDAWSGGTFDSTRNRLIVWGGGHNDYAGNEVYAFDMTTLQWSRLTSPSAPNTNNHGMYSDGTPSSRHTYAALAYLPDVDRMFNAGGAIYQSGGGNNMTWFFNFSNNTWQRRTDAPSPSNGECCGYAAAYDPITGHVFRSHGGGFSQYDPNQNTWTNHGGNSPSLYINAAIAPIERLMVAVGGGSYGVAGTYYWRLNPSAGAMTKANTAGDKTVELGAAPGFAWSSAANVFVGWNGGSSVYTLDPKTWVWAKINPVAANIVVPTAPNSRGTYGRFQYVPVMNVFVLVNRVHEDVYIYKPNFGDSASPSPSPTVQITASPSSLTSGSSSTLTWNSTNASSCTASGAWSGTKGISGSQSTGVLTVDSTFTLTCTSTAGSAGQSANVTVTAPPSATPPPAGMVGGYPMPSVQDEKNTYTSWGWTWTASKEPSAVTEPIAAYSVNNPSIHGDTEGDDLWSYLMMYRRTGNTVYLNRATAWANYFKNGYRQCTQGAGQNYCHDRDAFGLDHAYGWGLVAWYEHTGDAAALAAAENIAADIEALWAPGSTFGCYASGGCMWYGPRGPMRHLMIVTRVAQVTAKTRWITLRDKIISTVLNATWDTSRGMYFAEAMTDQYAGAGAHAGGIRIQSSFQAALITEAFDHAYRATGNTLLRDRIVAIARFVDRYGLDPAYQYAGSWFGLKDEKPWHNYSASGTTTFWDPVYTTALVNTLVRGYKYTGDITLLSRAKQFFNRGTKGIYGSTTQRQAADNVVGHFIDTTFSSGDGNFYLNHNAGELQYTYLIFENEGNPMVETGTTAPSSTLQVGATRQYKSIGSAVNAAQDGYTIEIDAGVYPNETITISKNNLTLRALGGYAHLKWGTGNYLTNTATISNGKGILVIQGNNITIENLELSGAKVVDKNGAGIRYEGGNLTIRKSYFHDNENGILGAGGLSNTLIIESSVFERNGYCLPSCAHNVYIGRMGKLIFRYNKSIDAHEGHPLKSRAQINEIISNYLSTTNSDGSYEANFPNGGTVYFIGNIVEQGVNSGNSIMLAYGEEGSSNPNPALYVVNNTFYNRRGSGAFLSVSGSPTLSVKNNIFAGGGSIGITADASNKALNASSFISASSGDYHLAAGSPAIDAGANPGTAGAYNLAPQSEYFEPAGNQPRVISGTAIDVGAYEFSGSPAPASPAAPSNLRLD